MLLSKLKNIIFTSEKCSRMVTWSVYRNLHLSTSNFKRRKTGEEHKMVQEVDFTKISSRKQIKVVEIWKNITVMELATAMNHSLSNVFEALTYVKGGASYNHPKSVIDDWQVILDVLKLLNYRWKLTTPPSAASEIKEEFVDVTRRDPSSYIDVQPRPPVVTIMGHVDHGKTTLLDYLRSSNIVEKEFGGITQHIGAFSVILNKKDRVTFLDTPGHAAFCAMRNRGAHCTDIVVLVIAADDGVMEQTVESIKMAKDAHVPIIVAINKIDKPQADIDRTKKMLLQHGIQVEDEGGEIQAVPISALKGTNVSTLVEAITVQADLMELKTDFKGSVEGVIIECTTDPHRGKLSTLLVQCGTLRKGTILIAGTAWCKVRAMFNDSGEPVSLATPSTPVQILGWRDLPSAGDVVLEVDSEKKAHRVIEGRKAIKVKEKTDEDLVAIEQKALEHYQEYKIELETKRKLGRAYRRKPVVRKKEYTSEDDGPRLNVIIKADVDGSVEAILDVLSTYDSDKCKLDVVHYGVGPVSLNDINLASTFSAVIYTFNTQVLPDVKKAAHSDKITKSHNVTDNVTQIKSHNVIYKLVDDIKEEINKLLPEKDVEETIGEANVVQEFLINEGKSKVPVAGCRCVKGNLKKNALVKLIRGEEVLYEGEFLSLRHLKDEVESVKKDLECGVRLKDQSLRFAPGDTIVCYKIIKVPQEINWDPGF